MIRKAKTKEEIIDLFHPNIKNQIPTNHLDAIAQNILLFEMYMRGETFIAPHEILTTRIYDYGSNQIIQIDYLGTLYKL